MGATLHQVQGRQAPTQVAIYVTDAKVMWTWWACPTRSSKQFQIRGWTMSTKSKRKGDGYERELAKWLDYMLFGGVGQVTRTPLSGGGAHIDGAGKADLQGTPTVWVEANEQNGSNLTPQSNKPRKVSATLVLTRCQS